MNLSTKISNALYILKSDEQHALLMPFHLAALDAAQKALPIDCTDDQFQPIYKSALLSAVKNASPEVKAFFAKRGAK